ncbi:hypothetical protein [Devosia sp.]|uniref:hypothetical protein n=1 Tax=Devosia sp. TaxID=1871048 RepID=UPI002EDFDB06
MSSRSRLDYANPAAGARYDCIVLDHQALTGPREQVIEFCTHAAPIILVSSTPIEWLSGIVHDLVEKPVMGGAIANSVRRILAGEGRMRTK